MSTWGIEQNTLRNLLTKSTRSRDNTTNCYCCSTPHMYGDVHTHVDRHTWVCTFEHRRAHKDSYFRITSLSLHFLFLNELFPTLLKKKNSFSSVFEKKHSICTRKKRNPKHFFVGHHQELDTGQTWPIATLSWKFRPRKNALIQFRKKSTTPYFPISRMPSYVRPNKTQLSDLTNQPEIGELIMIS